MSCEHGLTTKECYVCMSPKYGEKKNNMSITAMKQALEALEDARLYNYALKHKETDKLITSLRQAIEQYEKEQQRESLGVCLKCGANECGSRDCPMNTQPQEEHHAKDCALLQIPSRDCDCSQKQEPIAWAEGDEDGDIVWSREDCFSDDPEWLDNPMPLYTTPQLQRQWVGLTDEEINAETEKEEQAHGFIQGALWAETKLKEKNHVN